ncbi:MAG: hypothetical protein K9J13_06730 [Saprospiraceae bacterium]|nr:hypothetical protein [Saprospiraceae bacterium]
MDNLKIIQYGIAGILTVIIVSILTFYLHKNSSETSGQKKIMRMPRIYILLSNLLFVSSVCVEFAMFFNTSLDIDMFWKILYTVFGIVLFFGAWNTILLYFKHNVIYDTEIIELTSWLGQTRKIKWTEIEEISFSTIASSIRMKSGKEKLYVHEHLKGYKNFVKILEEKTNMKLKKITQ